MYAVVDPVANDLRSNIATAAENIAGIARAVAKVADKVLSSKPIIYESSGANIGAVAVIAEIEPPPLPPTPSPKERESKENKNNPEPSPLGREKGGVKKQDLTRSQVLENLKTNSLLEESVAGKASERDVLPVFDPIPIPTGIPGFGGGGGGGGATHSNVLQNTAIENNTQETPDVEEPAEPPAAPTYSSPNAGDIVINEIAWSGTEASAADEWIELYNRTANTISLASTTLFASDGSPYIKLSGTIGPRAYYLIEADESAISDITADLVASFGTRLSDTTGESLTLAHFDGSATTTIDALDDFSCINWCGYGGGAYYLSMERISPGLPGTEQASWGINRGYQNGMRNGADRNGAVMNGTPKQRNYSSYLVNNGNYNLTSGTLVLTAAGSPYFIDSAWFTVGQGATLTAEAGAVVKFWNQAGIRVNGTLNINGSASTSTVFTSYADDEYGGDLNKDETRTSPVAGNWFGIEFLPGSSGNINYATLRYGGKYYNQDGYTRAILSANESSPSITNSIVEKSMGYGILLAYASSTVSNNIIKDNYFENDTSNSYGLYGYGGAPNISNNIFSGNYRGLYFYDLLNATFSNNTFINNISFGFATST
jgi:parallel beta-helix repeat protein